MNGTNPSPMSLAKSLAYFALPWLVFAIATHLLIPTLGHAQVPLFVNFLVSLGIPLALLTAASLAGYSLEGGVWKWSAFQSRFRLTSMRGGTWLWTLGLSIFMFLAPAFLSFSSDWIRTVAPISAPLSRMFEINSSEFMGVPLAGAWWLVLGYLAYVIVNVSGEELWWRGYIFPRQEASLGKWTWLAHGLMWCLFHSFFYWELLILLPGCLALSYVAQRSRNTWPGIIAHFLYSVPTLAFMLGGAIGQ